MAYFAMKLVAPRPTFPGDATAEEKETMMRHSVYWREQADARRAIAVGPIFDPAGPFGLALVEVDDAAAAGNLASADPVIQAGMGFAYQIFPVPSLILRAAG